MKKYFIINDIIKKYEEMLYMMIVIIMPKFWSSFYEYHILENTLKDSIDS